MRLKEKFLIYSLGLLSLNVSGCSAFQHLRTKEIEGTCSSLEDGATQEQNLIQAINTLKRYRYAKALLERGRKNITVVCMEKEKPGEFQLDGRLITSNLIKMTNRKNQVTFTRTLYHELYHAWQDILMEELEEKASASHEEKITVPAQDFILKQEAAAYAAETRFAFEAALKNEKLLTKIDGHEKILYEEMEKAFYSYSPKIPQETRLNMASTAIFKMFLESEREEFKWVRDFYLQSNKKYIERHPSTVLHVSAFKALTTLPNGYDLSGTSPTSPKKSNKLTL